MYKGGNEEKVEKMNIAVLLQAAEFVENCERGEYLSRRLHTLFLHTHTDDSNRGNFRDLGNFV